LQSLYKELIEVIVHRWVESIQVIFHQWIVSTQVIFHRWASCLFHFEFWDLYIYNTNLKNNGFDSALGRSYTSDSPANIDQNFNYICKPSKYLKLNLPANFIQKLHEELVFIKNI